MLQRPLLLAIMQVLCYNNIQLLQLLLYVFKLFISCSQQTIKKQVQGGKKVKRWVKKLFFTFSVVALSLYLLPLSAFAALPADANNQTIKVFFPLQHGFASVDEGGNHAGYNYEYLMRVGQLTGWQYEFVPTKPTNDNLMSGLEKVKQGELHLVGTMNYSEELAEEYEYSLAYGESSYVLITKNDNVKINARTIIDYQNLKVAVVEGAEEQNALFVEFCRRNDIEFELIYGTDKADCLQLVDSGVADAAISKDVAYEEGFKAVAKFSSSPFYFVAKEGDVELIKQLNNALRSIEVSDPGYKERMHIKYFNASSKLDLPLTEEEREYVASAPVVRAAVLDGAAPIQSYNEATGEFSGILIDLLDIISERSGIEFELFNASDEALLKKALDDGTCDIVLGVPYVYSNSIATGDSGGVLLTPPVFSSPIIRISTIRDDIKNSEIIVSRSIKSFRDKENIIYSDNVEEIFDLINRGEYGEAYMNGYMAQNFAEFNNYPNVSLSFTSYGNYELCFGVSAKSDLRLINVLSQAIATFSEAEIEEIVYANTNHEIDNSIWRIVERNPAQMAIPVLVVLTVILGLLSLFFAKTRRFNKILSKEKNEYKTMSQLDRLSKTYNNAAFKQLAMDYLNRPNADISGALIICDIDNFKSINDTLGHLKGDEVIAALGALMVSVFRENDIVGRLGGDEFVVMLKDINSIKVVEKRCTELCNKSRNVIPEREVTLSVGAAIFTGTANFDELFKLADSALYDVKNSGKANYKICSHSDNETLNADEPEV